MSRDVLRYGNPLTYLGRAVAAVVATAVFIRCELGKGVRPEGWKEWNVKPPLVRFAEYGSTGPGAVTAGRVDWAVHSGEAAPAEYARAAVLGDWQP